MKKTFTLFRVLLTLVLLCGVGNAWGENKTLTFNLASNPGGWPTDNSTTLTNYTYTLDKTNYTFALKNVKCNSGYLMLTSTAVLGLPAIEGYQLTKVEAKNSSGCSTSTKVGISSSSSSASYITGGAIQTWSTTGSTYTYNLSGTSDNTVYYLYVTNKNAQITQLSLTYESFASVSTPTINPSNGSFVNSATAKITCATTGASIYYTTDGTNPTNASTAYTDTDPITVTETTTIKAIAYKDGEYSSVATATYNKIPQLTISAFIAAEVSNTLYVLEGKIIDIANSEYGNLTIKDNTGEVYVYGLKESSKAENNTFGNLNLKLGDVVKIVGKRGEYNNKVQVSDAFYNSHTTPEKENYTVTYNSLGVQLGSETVQEFGTVAEIPSSVTPPTGWSFVGWTTNGSYQSSTTSPTLFDKETLIIENTNLYAVFNKESGTSPVAYNKITGNLTDWRGDYLIAYSDEVFMDGSLAGGTAGVGKAQSHVAPGDALSDNTISAVWGDKYYVTIEAIDDTDLSNGYVIKSHSDTTPYFYQTSNSNGMASTANKSTAAAYPITISYKSANDVSLALGGNATGAVLRYNATTGSTGEMFRFYKDGGQQSVYLYRKEGGIIYTYTTVYPSITLTAGQDESGYYYATFIGDKNMKVSEDVIIATCFVESGKVQINDLKGSVIPANNPVLVYSDQSEIILTPTSDDADEDDELYVNDPDFNMLFGYTTDTHVEAATNTQYYALNTKEGKVGFFVPKTTDDTANLSAANGFTAKAGKAYLKVVGAGVSSGFYLTDDTATAIVFTPAFTKTDGVMYNLNGQVVDSDYKGIVIKNGKKYLNK